MKKNTFWTILAIIGFIIVNICSFMCVKRGIHVNQTKEYKGIVRDNETQLRNVKYGTKTDYYLAVDFDSIGFKVIEVSPQTFFAFKPHDRITMLLRNSIVEPYDLSPLLEITEMILGSLGFMCDIILIIFLIATGVEFINSKLED